MLNMACTGVLGFTTPPLNSSRKSKQQRKDTSFSCCSTSTSTNEHETATKFTYSRASPSVRWPHLKFTETEQRPLMKTPVPDVRDEIGVDGGEGFVGAEAEDEADKVFDKRPSRNRVKKMNKLALKRAKDWRKRVQFLTDRILELKSDEFVADVLDEKLVQMTPTDFCFVVKWVGQSSWQRALEVYEWLNLRHWYAPNARMLATILSVLGKANQEALAVEMYTRAESAVGNTVQVYNAMMGVYARNGRFTKVKELLDLMRERGCEPDLVSFNTLINARLRSGPMTPNLGIELLGEVRRSGIRPDIITYNTLISGCSRESNLEEAVKIFNDMEEHRCQPDLWTYNAMISVYGRCGLSGEAERLFKELHSKSFLPDAVTYNSLLYAFAREGNVVKVKEICQEFMEMGFVKDEMTYNTIISMYGKQGRHDIGLQTYREMQSSGRHPDAVTYTVLIDSLGKANKMAEAANVMSEMLDTGVRPTIRTYSALICGYAKAGQRAQAEETFDCMMRSGIKPDKLAYAVMLDVHIRSKNTKKAVMLYQDMVSDGYVLDLSMYEALIRVLAGESNEKFIKKVVEHLEELHGLSSERISVILTKAGCYDFAAEKLRLAVMKNSRVNQENLLSILGSYSLSGRHSEAIELLNFVQKNAPGSEQLIAEALVVIYCNAGQLDAALDEYHKNNSMFMFEGSSAMYEFLIVSCADNECYVEASQIYSDMKFYGIEPSAKVYQMMALSYCKLDLPETAHHLYDLAEIKGVPLHDTSVCTSLIEAYAKVKQLEKAESVVGRLRQKCKVLDRKVWNSLLEAYALSGCYEKARAAFNTMMRDGPSPTVDTMNFLLQALVVDGRLDELYIVIQDLQDMGFKISKSSIILMLEAFAQSGNVFEVKKIYHGMKAAGYLPTMHLYKVIIGLLSRAKQVMDVEAMVSEMGAAGFTPDLVIYNLLLKMYMKIEDYKKTIQIYQRIRECELKPDEETYSTLILMYCRDCRPEEAALLMHEMRRLGLKPQSDTYKSLIAAFCKKMMIEQAEELFYGLKSEGNKLDRSFYHLMMKMYRTSGNHAKAENLLVTMKESGIEPTAATMHLLMTSYGSSGRPEEAEKVLNSLKATGSDLGTLSYSSVIDAYLKNGDLDVGIQKLEELRNEGLDPDHRIWTCFIRAASLCHSFGEATMLLNAIGDAGFRLPIRLLTDNSMLLLSEIDCYLKSLEAVEDNASFHFVNALEDLLWAFERRATATWIFQLAVKRNIYHKDVFRVADKDWGADFRKLSAGAALVGLTLWLDHMQDASLEGFPESPKSVVLITGNAEYNKVSLNSTLKAYLWEMGSPFLPCKTRSGVLIAKAHSLRLWLKDSAFCSDLELKDSPLPPETNSMQLVEGCYIRRGLVPAFSDIRERLGEVRPRKFARLALLSDEKRDAVIRVDVEGRREKLAKMENGGVVMKKKMKMSRFSKGKFTRRRASLSEAESGVQK
ncbi:pentatricopeptide repeat-containing protein At3g18110, chloroplastic [Salvia miltiorrhiza]|uniref:pentatricopeptide repeat-containing protein At3g18110, chloroplastic n=1 Tax=Salvia miltiorrhiza TaxID=226208 RepID=UPI0025ABC641|nr:pentatricopeptide repeat-containing protein At3g18110, chloroplastic [Salvia miltiorrhiza]